MTGFEGFCRELEDLAKKFESNGVPLRVERDGKIIRVFGEGATSLARAQNGLSDITELAYATSEHHPYWDLLYNCADIASSVLDRWQGSLSKEDIADIRWAIQKLDLALEKQKSSQR